VHRECVERILGRAGRIAEQQRLAEAADQRDGDDRLAAGILSPGQREQLGQRVSELLAVGQGLTRECGRVPRATCRG
jgi:hypothetical protein